MSFFVELDPQAEKDLDHHIKVGNKILLKRIYRLFEDLEKHPNKK